MSELDVRISEQQEFLLQSQLRQFKYKQLQHCDSLLDRAICEHENVALRLCSTGGGDFFFQWQCQSCGEVIGSAIGEKGADAIVLVGSHSRYTSINRDLYVLGKYKKQIILDRYHTLSDICIFLEEYKPFKGSVLWQQKLQKIMTRNGGLCEDCKDKPITEVHVQSHTNDVDDDYEFRFELLGLCETCHTCWHPV